MRHYKWWTLCYKSSPKRSTFCIYLEYSFTFLEKFISRMFCVFLDDVGPRSEAVIDKGDETIQMVDNTLQVITKKINLLYISKLGFKIIAPFLNGPFSKNSVLFCKFSFLYLKVQLFSFKLT